MQARRGEAAYQSNCAACHGRNLQATNPDAPSLTAPSFGISWHGKPVADLFTLMRTSMPLGAGGSLSDPEYLDIVAYILKFNGYPAGDRELGPEVERLKQIVIEPKNEAVRNRSHPSCIRVFFRDNNGLDLNADILGHRHGHRGTLIPSFPGDHVIRSTGRLQCRESGFVGRSPDVRPLVPGRLLSAPRYPFLLP